MLNMSKKTKFYLVYVEKCTPAVVCFDTEDNMKKWIKIFKKTHFEDVDSWLDFSIKGDTLKAYDKSWSKPIEVKF